MNKDRQLLAVLNIVRKLDREFPWPRALLAFARAGDMQGDPNMVSGKSVDRVAMSGPEKNADDTSHLSNRAPVKLDAQTCVMALWLGCLSRQTSVSPNVC